MATKTVFYSFHYGATCTGCNSSGRLGRWRASPSRRPAVGGGPPQGEQAIKDWIHSGRWPTSAPLSF